jgi:hydroxyacylglutathione hydrolase
MSWKIDCVVVGPIQCNCYILSDSVAGKAYLIDPGAESKELLDFLQKKKVDLQAILITHAHIDHIGGIEMLCREIPSPVYYHTGDKFLYENIQMQAQLFGVTPRDLQAEQPKSGNASLENNRVFPFENGEIRVIHTPGHTPGSVCFHAIGDGSALFTGDTLFKGSIGRTDLWGGSFEQIMESIKGGLMSLSDGVQVLPGHGDPTSIGAERRQNPFLLT